VHGKTARKILNQINDFDKVELQEIVITEINKRSTSTNKERTMIRQGTKGSFDMRMTLFVTWFLQGASHSMAI
jgi:hypothetical protein